MYNDLIGFKSTQYAGRNNISTREIEGSLIESRTSYSPNNAQEQQYIQVVLTLEATSQLNPYGRVEFLYFESDKVTQITDGSIAAYTVIDIPTPVDSKKYSWVVQLLSPIKPYGTSSRFYAKPIVFASDTGSITSEAW